MPFFLLHSKEHIINATAAVHEETATVATSFDDYYGCNGDTLLSKGKGRLMMNEMETLKDLIMETETQRGPFCQLCIEY